MSTADFRSVFSVCIGKSLLYQKRFIEYLGEYGHWDVSIKEGLLQLDDRKFNVEFIGTTADGDDYWYSAELESVIPDAYIDIMMNTRKTLEALNIPNITEGHILLDGDVNGFDLSMIYIAFAPQDVAYFCGSGNASIYMFVKDLPADIFRKLEAREFPPLLMQILSEHDVDHKLMVEALLSENDIAYEVADGKIVANFGGNSVLNVEFNADGFVSGISGNLG